MPNIKHFIGSSNVIMRVLKTFLEILLNRQQANMFDPQHLQGASSDLVRSMFQVGRKVAELERTKLQMEIQKEKSEIRKRQLENRLKMENKGGGGGGPVKNPKKTKTKQEEDDDDWLDDLVVDMDPDKQQTSYSNLEPGGFVTKGADRKSRLDQRHARIAAAAGEQDDDDDDEDETEQEKLEREANELSSQLKKVERAEAQARDKEEGDKAKRYSTRISEGRYLKQPKAVTLVQTKKRKKSMKMENIRNADEEDEPDDIPEGFHLHEQSLHCINMK